MRIIRASEVAEYSYCARAWWLRHVAGLEPAGQLRRDRGVAAHARHGRAVQSSGTLLALGGLLLLLSLLLLFGEFWPAGS